MKRNKRSATVSHCNMPCCTNKDNVHSRTTTHLEDNGQTRQKKSKNNQNSHRGKKSPSQSSSQQAAHLAGGGNITHTNKQAVNRLHQKRKRSTVPHQSPFSSINHEENDIQVLQVSEDEETSTSEKSTSSDEEESDNDEGIINFRDIISSPSNYITERRLILSKKSQK